MTTSQSQFINTLDRYIGLLVFPVAFIMFLYHMLIVWYPIFGEHMNQNTHLGFSLVLLFLYWSRHAATLWKKLFNLLGVLVSLALVIYVAYHYERLTFEAGWPQLWDIVVGISLITIVISSTWRCFGAVFPIMVLVAIAYALWGHHIKGIFSHPYLEFGYIVSSFSVGIQGIYGILLNISVNMLFLYLVFGALFEATGVTKFFLEFGKLISRYMRGGPGHNATFSSSFVGMVNGVAAANVAITGSYTIPTMKKSGFKGEIAVGVEAMASTGGQLTPPIMGVAVFVMAGFLGVSYGDLMAKALLPAIAYYAVAVLGVFLIAFREDIPKGKDIPDKRILLSGLPVFVLPMGLLTTVLLLHYSPGYSAFLGIVCLLLVSCLLRETRPSLKLLEKSLVSGVILGAKIGIVCACLGIFVKSLTFTGAATKLSLFITTISGGHLLPTLILTGFLSILLGGSLPSVVAYIMVAFVAAPILMEMGVAPVVSHFFVYYYAILASVTPPIAGGAIIGSQIAHCNYMKASWESMKLAGPFFLLPFFIINNPIMFLEAQNVMPAVLSLLALMIAMFATTCFCQRYCFTHTSKVEHPLFFLASLLATWYGLYSQKVFLIMALMLIFGLLANQWRKKKVEMTKEPLLSTASAGISLINNEKEVVMGKFPIHK